MEKVFPIFEDPPLSFIGYAITNIKEKVFLLRTDPQSLVYELEQVQTMGPYTCLLYTSPSPRDRQKSRMPSSA